MIVLGPHPVRQRRIETICWFCQLFPSSPQIHMPGKSLKPQSLFLILTFLSKTIHVIWQPVFTTNPQIRIATYCTHLPTHLMSKIQFSSPNFSGSVDFAAMIQTLTPNVMKCLISFSNVAILATFYPNHSIMSKTSMENLL